MKPARRLYLLHGPGEDSPDTWAYVEWSAEALGRARHVANATRGFAVREGYSDEPIRLELPVQMTAWLLDDDASADSLDGALGGYRHEETELRGAPNTVAPDWETPTAHGNDPDGKPLDVDESTLWLRIYPSGEVYAGLRFQVSGASYDTDVRDVAEVVGWCSYA